jgi:hypothetical protein
VQHAGQLNVGCIPAFANHKSFVLDRSAVFANEAKGGRAHGQLFSGFVACITASTIC